MPFDENFLPGREELVFPYPTREKDGTPPTFPPELTEKED